jgi:hypothetical protein
VEKEILTGPTAGGRYWVLVSSNYKTASVNTSRPSKLVFGVGYLKISKGRYKFNTDFFNIAKSSFVYP